MADPSIFAASHPELRRGLCSARGTASAAALPAEAIAHDDSNNDGNDNDEDKVMVQRQPQTTIKQQLGTYRQ